LLEVKPTSLAKLPIGTLPTVFAPTGVASPVAFIRVLSLTYILLPSRQEKCSKFLACFQKLCILFEGTILSFNIAALKNILFALKSQIRSVTKRITNGATWTA